MSYFLKEYRCEYCRKLFFKGDLTRCTIEIKCKGCKQLSKIEGASCDPVLRLDQPHSYELR